MNAVPRSMAAVLAVAALAVLAGCGPTNQQRPVAPVAASSPAVTSGSPKPPRSLPPDMATECTTVADAYRVWLATAPPTTLADAEKVTINRDIAMVKDVQTFENAFRTYPDAQAKELELALANYQVAVANLGVALAPGGSGGSPQLYSDLVNTVKAVSDQYATFQATTCT